MEGTYVTIHFVIRHADGTEFRQWIHQALG
jgi:hypothetical protein